MGVRWKFRHRRRRSGSFDQDGLGHVAVGDPDPTLGVSVHCRFEWAEHTSRRLILPWFCTRELGHQGQHLAGTGEWVAAVHSQLLPSTRATSVSV
jgi:hypothetical protein